MQKKKLKIKRSSINKAQHRLDLLKARGAKPRRIERALNVLAHRIAVEHERKERVAEAENKNAAEQEDNA